MQASEIADQPSKDRRDNINPEPDTATTGATAAVAGV
jgi:hypothetical protein